DRDLPRGLLDLPGALPDGDLTAEVEQGGARSRRLGQRGDRVREAGPLAEAALLDREPRQAADRDRRRRLGIDRERGESGRAEGGLDLGIARVPAAVPQAPGRDQSADRRIEGAAGLARAVESGGEVPRELLREGDRRADRRAVDGG